MTALDPCFTIGSQLAEPLRQHRKLNGKALDDAVVTALEQVHLPATRERLKQYPHQLSGGMRQRVTSAIALAGQPASAHRRRTDDRTRRDHPGALPRAAARVAAEHRIRAAAGGPRPDGGPACVLPGRGDVFGARSSRTGRQASVSTHHDIHTRGHCLARSRRSATPSVSRRSMGRRPRWGDDARLPVRAALQAHPR